MKRMSSYIAGTGNAIHLAALCTAEIDDHLEKLPAYGNQDWPDSEKQRIALILEKEASCIVSCTQLSATIDSVKGESAMQEVYAYQKKASDIITLHNCLVLIELKYLIKVGGVGPFGGPSSFKKRVSDKFLEMGVVLVEDAEQVHPLRIIVTSEEQYPYSLAHIHGLIDSEFPPGSFSSDNQQYEYVLCSSKSLRSVVDTSVALPVGNDVFAFKL